MLTSRNFVRGLLQFRLISTSDGSGGTYKGKMPRPHKKAKKDATPVTSRLEIIERRVGTLVSPLNASSSGGGGTEDRLAEQRARRARLLEIWQHRNGYCEANFDDSNAILTVDREPLVENSGASFSTNLIVTNCKKLRYKLMEYGLVMDIDESVLLDFMDGPTVKRPDIPLFGCSLTTMRPPAELKVSLDGLKTEVARQLGGRFMSQRRALYELKDQYQRELLMKLHGMTFFHHIYRYCPTCGAELKMRSSKAFAKCLPCNRRFYPTITPLVTCLVRDPNDSHCVLLRPCGRPPTVFMPILGVPEGGESLSSAVLREVARSVGLLCSDVRAVNLNQTWTAEAKNVLTTAFTAVAPMSQKLDPFFNDIACTSWFSREDVARALQNSRQNADYLEEIEAEYDNAFAAEMGDLKYETRKRRRREKPYYDDRMVETMSTFDTYEDSFDATDDYTVMVEEPVVREPVRESFRRYREEDYNKYRYHMEEYDEDEREANLPEFHVDRLYKREREQLRREEEERSGRKVIDQEELLEEARRQELRERIQGKKDFQQDSVFQVPGDTSTTSSSKKSRERLQFVPPVGTIAHTLLQAWVDKKL